MEFVAEIAEKEIVWGRTQAATGGGGGGLLRAEQTDEFHRGHRSRISGLAGHVWLDQWLIGPAPACLLRKLFAVFLGEVQGQPTRTFPLRLLLFWLCIEVRNEFGNKR